MLFKKPDNKSKIKGVKEKFSARQKGGERKIQYIVQYIDSNGL